MGESEQRTIAWADRIAAFFDGNLRTVTPSAIPAAPTLPDGLQPRSFRKDGRFEAKVGSSRAVTRVAEALRVRQA